MTVISTENRMAIHELVAEYSHCVDNYRGKAWSELFLEDGRLVGTDNPFLGRQALADQCEVLREGDTEYRHVITNVYLDATSNDEEATAFAYGTVVDWAIKPPAMSIFVEYRFSLVRRGAQWKIAELHVDMPYWS